MAVMRGGDDHGYGHWPPRRAGPGRAEDPIRPARCHGVTEARWRGHGYGSAAQEKTDGANASIAFSASAGSVAIALMMGVPMPASTNARI